MKLLPGDDEAMAMDEDFLRGFGIRDASTSGFGNWHDRLTNVVD